MAPTEEVLVERPADGASVVVFSGEHDLERRFDPARSTSRIASISFVA